MATGRTKWEGYGRTRCPKNVIGAHGAGAVTVLAHDAVPSGITATDGTGGYPTENQRYLHVMVDPAAAGAPDRDIEVWAYSYFSGVWAKYGVIDCSGITENTTFVSAIYGIDRVAFVRDAGAWGDAPDAVYAACNTF